MNLRAENEFHHLKSTLILNFSLKIESLFDFRAWPAQVLPTSYWASWWCSEQQHSPSADWMWRLPLWRPTMAGGPLRSTNTADWSQTVPTLCLSPPFDCLYRFLSFLLSLAHKHTQSEIAYRFLLEKPTRRRFGQEVHNTLSPLAGVQGFI